MHDSDVRGGKLRARVFPGHGRVVPLLDLAQEDVGEEGPAEAQLGGQAGQVVGGHHAPQDRGQVDDRARSGLQLLFGHGPVGGAEEDRLVGELADAAARADRLVVDPDVGTDLVVLREPLRVDGVRERGARAVDLPRSGRGTGGRFAGRQRRGLTLGRPAARTGGGQAGPEDDETTEGASHWRLLGSPNNRPPR